MDFFGSLGGGGGGGPSSSASAASTQGGDTITFGAGGDQATTIALVALAVLALVGVIFAFRK